MSSKDKIQAPVRLYPDQYEKIREKVRYDGLSYQKLAEILFKLYLKNNKEVMKHVEKFVEQKGNRKNRPMLDEMESDELLRVIEENYSPLREDREDRSVEEIIEEIEDEPDLYL